MDKRKKYLTPTTFVVCVKAEGMLLAASGMEVYTNEETDSSDEQYSRRDNGFDLWADDEQEW
ncbi:MAG: hypothetical protein IJ612_07260 [Prevotella sp.]|nr:hypothetical protein [Prevotella sp.]